MPSSNHSSTACSNPDNDTVERVLKNDTVRYARKGYGIIVAALLIFTFFFIVPHLIKTYLWERFLSLGSLNIIYGFSVYGVHEFMFISSNLLMWFIYTQKIPFFENYRINPNRKWPWEESSQQWMKILSKSIRTLLFAHCFIIPASILVDIWNGVKVKTSIEEFPETLEIITQITFFMFVEDFCFYWVHRMLHQKRLYPYIHKIHHEYNNPIGISSEYSHPIEFFLANIVPTSLGVKLLGSKVHLVTYLLWGTLRIFETIDGHCGYEFSWSPYRLLPLSGSANYHNYHHTHNVGNYGSFFMIWDVLMGTNKSYFIYLSKKEKDLALNKMRQEYLKDKEMEKRISDEKLKEKEN